MIGIIQGRLSNAPKNRLQFFPKKWDLEFETANICGYDYIEFFSERQLNKTNPIWNKKNLKNYSVLAKKNNLKIYSFVDDYIISNSINNEKTIIYLKKLIKNLSALRIKKLILPMYGKSIIKSNNLYIISSSLNNICRYALKRKIEILLETNINPNLYFKLKNLIKKNISLVIDTGNRVNHNRNLYKDIEIFGKHIKHMHVKDKNKKNENVKLGKGNVNFAKLKNSLIKIKYRGSFTIESTRDGNPIKTAKHNLIFLKKKLFNSSYKF